MTESMKEVMYGWDSTKENRIQDKTHGEDHDDRLFRERDIMFSKQVYLSLNVFELLDGGHGLPQLCTLGATPGKKIPIPHPVESGLSRHVYTLSNRPLQRWTCGSPDQVSWLPGSLLTHLPMVAHSGVSSFRARYSCGNSGPVALLFSEETICLELSYHRGTAYTLSIP